MRIWLVFGMLVVLTGWAAAPVWAGTAGHRAPGARTVVGGETVSTGSGVCVVRRDGIAACAGGNGLGGYTVPAGLGTVTAISSGTNHSCVVKTDGTAACWGYNPYGQSTVWGYGGDGELGGAPNTPAPAPLAGTIGESYAHTFTSSAGSPPASYSISAGTLPPGLAFSPTAVLSGTPTSTGQFTFTVVAQSEVFGSSQAQFTLVIRAAPTLSTNASGNTVLGAGTLTDSATVSGRVTPATGATVDFRLYGPDDVTCTGTPASSSLNIDYPIAGGPVTSPEFTPTRAGSYRWIASYSGDTNNNSTTGACNDANETTVVAQKHSTLTGVASDATVGGTIHESISLTGGTDPGGTLSFALYGVGDADCADTAIYTSILSVADNGTYDSGDFSPVSAGTYRWTAFYSGDGDNEPASSACNAAGGTSTVAQAVTAVASRASSSSRLADPIRDSATLSAGFSPSGKITFSLYGPGDTACANPPAFTSSPVLVSGNGAYDSDAFTPTAAGTYRWIARYGGDGNNAPAASECSSAEAALTVPEDAPPAPSVLSLTVARTNLVRGTHIPVRCIVSQTSLTACAVTLTTRGRAHTVLARGLRTTGAAPQDMLVTARLTAAGRRLLDHRFSALPLIVAGNASVTNGPALTAQTTTRALRPTHSFTTPPSSFVGQASVLTARGLRVLHDLAARIGQARTIRCTGYTADLGRGNTPNARRIGAARARAVCAVLRRLGVRSHFVTSTRATHNPIATNRTAAGRAANRRVAIRITHSR